MPELDKRLFGGSLADISPTDSGKIEVTNLTSSIDDNLKLAGWKGEACGCIGLTLSADNSRVERGILVVRGKLLEESLRIEANKLWADADENVVLTLSFPKAEVFTFNETGLSSDIIKREQIQHGFYIVEEDAAPSVVLEAEYEELGIRDFCMRMLCAPS